VASPKNEDVPIHYVCRRSVRAAPPRLYVSFPLTLAAAIGLEAGEEVEWEILNRGELHLRQPNPPAPAAKIRAGK